MTGMEMIGYICLVLIVFFSHLICFFAFWIGYSIWKKRNRKNNYISKNNILVNSEIIKFKNLFEE